MALWDHGLFTQDQGVTARKRNVCVVRRGFVAVVSVALLFAGCGVLGDDRLGSGPHMESPEADAINYLAVRDEALDAEVLWTGIHDDVKAETSRSQFIDCVYARADRAGPAAPASAHPETLEHPGQPSIADVASYGGEVAHTNVLVRDRITYSVADRRDDRGIISVDVRVEGPQDTSVTTVLLGFGGDDPHWSDPRYSPEGYGSLTGFVVVGTVPEDPCLVGAEAVRERLQTTGMVSVGHHEGQSPLAELMDYRVLAVVWDSAPDELNLVGGAFWWADDEGNGRDGIHPPTESGGETAREVEDDPDRAEGDEPPPRAPDWVDRAFLPTEAVRIEPGIYTIEVWANPSELTPSANPSIPAETAERNCTVEVEVTAGTRTIVSLNDIPNDGGECSHETESRFGFWER